MRVEKKRREDGRKKGGAVGSEPLHKANPTAPPQKGGSDEDTFFFYLIFSM